jgi:hypothetical protein
LPLASYWSEKNAHVQIKGKISMKELTNDLLITEIFSLLLTEPRTIEELTNTIYKNLYAKNIIRVYQTIEILLKRGIVTPKFQNRILLFQIDRKVIGGKQT